MIKPVAYFKIVRPVNAVLSSIGVALGFWLTNVKAPLTDLLLLLATATCALGFGNVINDIKDTEGDRINHPDRPIPKGEISSRGALIFALLLAIVSLLTSYRVSVDHCIAAAIPLILLTLYTLFLKGTPLVGNILISLLVAYTLIFGSIHSPDITIILIPAFLAFLLNLSREIIKDLQDKEGDIKAGVRTTAALSGRLLKTVLIIPGLFYIPSMFLPYILGHFQWVYLTICIAVLLPMHLFWFFQLCGKGRTVKPGLVSTVIKIEMLGGLFALALDRLILL